MNEQDLTAVRGGTISLSCRQATQQADNDISLEELTIVHEYIVRVK